MEAAGAMGVSTLRSTSPHDLLDVAGDTPIKDRDILLADALDDTSAGGLLRGAAIGQFAPRAVGGANATTGFDAESLVNPWDFVLAIEGTVAFCGGLAKRLASQDRRITFPFAFHSIAGGYASASSEEEARGEVWLPVWEGAATYSAVSAMLRSGRADLPSIGNQPDVKTALNAAQATQAALSLGVSLGVTRFERIAFVQRNGKNYAATQVGTVFTDNDKAIALLSLDVTTWIERIRSRIATLGKAASDALHRFYAALFELGTTPPGKHNEHAPKRARVYADLLIALSALDFAIAVRGHDEISPLQYLDPELFEFLDDGSIEHRAALALVSLGYGKRETAIRLHLEHVRYNNKGHFVYAPGSPISATPSLIRTLGDIFERRITTAIAGDHRWLEASAALNGADIGSLSEHRIDDARLFGLLRAYALVTPPLQRPTIQPPPDVTPRPGAAFALLKIVLDHPQARDRRIVTLLRARDSSRAIALALQRARAIPNLPAPPRSIASATIADPEWYAAALLVPIHHTADDYAPLLHAALSHRPNTLAIQHYVNSLTPEKEH